MRKSFHRINLLNFPTNVFLVEKKKKYKPRKKNISHNMLGYDKEYFS